ncbi:gag-pol, partial [Mucuna pruriens]
MPTCSQQGLIRSGLGRDGSKAVPAKGSEFIGSTFHNDHHGRTVTFLAYTSSIKRDATKVPCTTMRMGARARARRWNINEYGYSLNSTTLKTYTRSLYIIQGGKNGVSMSEGVKSREWNSILVQQDSQPIQRRPRPRLGPVNNVKPVAHSMSAIQRPPRLQLSSHTTLEVTCSASHNKGRIGISLCNSVRDVSFRALGIEVDKSKIDVIASLPNPASVWEDRLTSALILQVENWDLPFELMCDASNSALGAVLGQRGGVGQPVHFPPEASRPYKEKLQSDAKYYIWDDPYLWRLCSDKVIHRFGVPKALISDQGSHFCNRAIASLLQKYGMAHRIATTYHPQTNGQDEVFNREIKQTLQKMKNSNTKDWSRLLKDALWAHRTAYRTPLEMKFQIQELDKLRLEAYENSEIYKQKVKKFHDQKILRKDISIDQKVLLFNSRLKLIVGKLRSRWDEPFVITNIFPHGAIQLKDEQTNNTFQVNGHQIKPFHEGLAPTINDMEIISLVEPTPPDVTA